MIAYNHHDVEETERIKIQNSFQPLLEMEIQRQCTENQKMEEKKTCENLTNSIKKRAHQIQRSKKIKKRKRPSFINLSQKAIQKIQNLSLQLTEKLNSHRHTQNKTLQNQIICLTNRKNTHQFVCYQENQVLQSSAFNKSLLKDRLFDNDVDSDQQQLQISIAYMHTEVANATYQKSKKKLKF